MLRPDVQLNEAPPEPEGAPTWTLYDPAANKYYKIGWLEFECLTRFGECTTAAELAAKVERETALQPGEEAVRALVMFLIQNNLVVASGEMIAAYFDGEREKKKKHWWERALHGYLFFTIPLFKSQPFLERLYPKVSFLFTARFVALVFALLAYGFYLSLSRLDEMATTFMSYLNIEGVILFLFTTILVKIVHEMGHALTATKYGVPVPVMGIAFIVMYPVLYSETTNAWKLQSRRDRIYIAIAGVMAEVALASVALLLWHMLSPGLAQSVCFMVAIVSLATSIAINVNPLMRYDGYYLVSDLMGFDNLQDRALAFMKWHLRRFLWNWHDDKPEYLAPDRERFLTIFGFAITVYRFFLYLGIALLVYHIFFQPLGFVLMMVELLFFILFPIYRELKVWRERKAEIHLKTKGGALAGVLAAFLVLSFLPLMYAVNVPAVMHAAAYSKIYPPVSGKIEEIYVGEGTKVLEGDVLFKMSSPTLDYQIKAASQKLNALESIRNSSQADVQLAKKRVTVTSEIDQARAELEGHLKVAEQMIIKAPHEGTVRDLDHMLKVGQWVAVNHRLGLVVDERHTMLTGYVREHDIARLRESGKGRFYPEADPFSSYDIVLESVDNADTTDIYWSELSSVYHGDLPAEIDGQGHVRALPRHTIYMVRFKMAARAEKKGGISFVERGTVRLEAEPATMANALFKKAFSAIFSENGG